MRSNSLSIPILCLVLIMLMAFHRGAWASNQAAPEDDITDLTDLSLEELVSVDFSSVMKSRSALKNTPASIFVLTSEEIRRTGATSIPEALRVVPGLHVARIDSNKWAISTRGFSAEFANKLLVLMDGRAVYTPFFSGTWWDQEDVMMDDIERIEVIRGPGASLWGANAVNGVINIVTKNARNTQGGLVSAYGGNMRVGGGLRYGMELDKNTHLKVYGRHSNYDEAKLPNSNIDAGDNSRLSKMGFRLDKNQGASDKFNLQGDAFIGFSGGANQLFPTLLDDERPTTSPAYYHQHETDVSYSGHYLMGRWEHAISNDESTALRFFWSRNERKAILIEAGYQIDTLDLDFQHNLRLNDQHYLIWGAGGRLNFNNTQNSLEFSWYPQHRMDEIYSLFVQDEITLVPNRWTLTLGGKLEHNPVTYFEWQPNARLSWTPDPHQFFWGSVSRAVRTPNWWEQDTHYHAGIIPPRSGGAAQPTDPATLITLIGNRGIKSEKLVAYELGWRGEFTPQLTADASLFYYDYHHVSSVSPVSLDSSNIAAGYLLQTNTFTNYGLVDVYGGEISVDWKVLENWKLRASYAHTEEIFDLSTAAPAMTSVPNAGGYPTHQAMVWSMLQLNPAMTFDLNWRYVDGVRVNANFSPAYHQLDARLAWNIGHGMELAVVGRNLLEKQHTEFGSDFYSQTTAVQREIFAYARWHF